MDITITNLTKMYGSFKAVDKVSFSIKPKTIFGLLGPNGAGKTSIIRILSGLSDFNFGSIEIGKYNYRNNQKDIKRIIGVVPQFRNLDGESTVIQNLYFHGRLYKIDGRILKYEINKLLDQFELIKKKDTLVKNLSGGTQQKVLIIRALVSRPKLLIMDEPTVGLDPSSRIELWNFIKKIKNNHSILLTTQDLNEADYLSDEIGIINKGKLIKTDSPQGLKEKFNNNLTNIFIEVKIFSNKEQLFIEELQALKYKKVQLDINSDQGSFKIKTLKEHINQIIDIINSFKIIDLKIYEPTLEEVFIDLTKN